MSENTPVEPTNDSTPPPPSMSTESPAVDSQLKPLRWLPAGLVALLASFLAGIALGFAAILLVGLPILAGVLAHSVLVGLLVGIPMMIAGVVLYIYLPVRFTNWLLGAFDYKAPSFWQTLLALLIGNLVASIISFIVYGIIIVAGVVSVSSNNASAAFTVLLLIAMPLTLAARVVCVGFALEKMSAVAEATAKKVSIIIASVIGFFAIAIIALAAAVSIPRMHGQRDSAKNSQAISNIREAETALNTYFNLNNETFGASAAVLAKEMNGNDAAGREKGLVWTAVAVGKPGFANSGSHNNPKQIFIEAVKPGRYGGASFCVGSQGTKNYCGAILGNAPTQYWTLSGDYNSLNTLVDAGLEIMPGSAEKDATVVPPAVVGGKASNGWQS